MQLRLRTTLTLVMTSLVLLVVAVLSGVFLEQLLQQALHETDKRANEIAHEAFDEARHALKDAENQGLRPAPNALEDTAAYVRQAVETNDALLTKLKASTDSPAIYEVSIVDRNGLVLVSSDSALRGSNSLRRPPLAQLVQSPFIKQIKILAGQPQVYEVDYPFSVHGEPFGEVRVVMATTLLLHDIKPRLRTSATIVILALGISTFLAAAVSGATLAPLRDIAAQLDRISAGQYDSPQPQRTGFVGGSDELGQVSRKITQVGQQLRGVHEIFSTMRENLNSVMAGLEDGLLLFTRDARAVMVSLAAEKFMGAPAVQFLGRRVTEIFPEVHPLRQALRLEGDALRETTAETELKTASGIRRVGGSVQGIQENGEQMGALVTLRARDSLESINTQLQVSERLAALGRITAGVAHEVKNPLNSMRLWLENLRESLPADQDAGAQQAVNVLDKEIDRLDAGVKRFLDFTRPMEIRLEATQLSELLREVLEIAQPQLQKANILLAQLLPIDVPEVYVDRALLKQAVLNLVLNAAEAMPNGGQLRLGRRRE